MDPDRVAIRRTIELDRRRSSGSGVCPACKREFKEGEYATIVTLGPGPSEEAQERCREGRAYNAVCVEVHWTCATGLP